MISQEAFENLKNHLDKVKKKLVGEWVKTAKYEEGFASAIGAKTEKSRYWDCVWQNVHLELKKSKSGLFWLDLVRYSEYLLKKNSDSQEPVITLFMIYHDQVITDIFATTTDTIIQKINLLENSAKDLLRINKEVLRSLNAQACLTKADTEDIATFRISTKPPKTYEVM